MAITVTLIVEDGTGKSDANSFASIDAFRLYWAQKNIDYSDNTIKGQTDNDIAAALITATEYIDGLHFFGARCLNSQALSFPRTSLSRPGSSDMFPEYFPVDTVPPAVVQATCYMAGIVIQGKDIDGVIQKVTSQSVSGVGSVTYSDGSGELYFPKLKTILRGILNPSLVVARGI